MVARCTNPKVKIIVSWPIPNSSESSPSNQNMHISKALKPDLLLQKLATSFSRFQNYQPITDVRSNSLAETSQALAFKIP
jgi:hypothetical protein